MAGRDDPETAVAGHKWSTPSYHNLHYLSDNMAISKRVQRELVQAAPPAAGSCVMPQTQSTRRRRRSGALTTAKREPPKLTKAQRDAAAARSKGKAWTVEEHERFLDALKRFPAGPWKAIAAHIGTKNSRQTMTHAQKCREKHERKTRGLRHRVQKTKVLAATQRQTSRHRAVAARMRRQENTTEDSCASEDHGDNVDQGENHVSREQDAVLVDNQAHDNMQDQDCVPEVMDEEMFYSGCDDIDTAVATGSPPSMSLLSLPEPLLFASEDLWHSQSFSDMKLCVDANADDATDLEDLPEFSTALSQECW